MLHHVTNLVAFLRTFREALNPDGIFVCQEAACADTLEANIGTGGAMLYAIGVMG